MNNKEHSCIDMDLIKDHIQKYGLSVVKVDGNGYAPAFAYSVGLTETMNHPEIICFGLPKNLMHALINDVAEIIRVDGKIDLDREYTTVFKNSRAAFLQVDAENIGEYLRVAARHYDTTDFDVIQLVWTDRNNKFPWEEEFEEAFKHMQPLTDRNAHFRFNEAKNLCVFTTSQFVDDNAPILHVVHEKDGDWQFLTKEVDFENAKLICLEEMIQRDDTLNELYDLDYGEEAERAYLGDPWKRKKINYDDE